MPYIKQEEREHWISIIEEFEKKLTIPFGPGDLNFILTCICLSYISNRKKCYSTYNEVMGVLESMKQEIYRRSIAPYEDTKIKENGDL